ncbi:MAG: extracellular solute-binding protein [Clostridiales bacterium]|nr:extracellular solute-binding protein [Clostridiales bacterium]
MNGSSPVKDLWSALPIKRFTAGILIAAMILSVAGCKKKGNGDTHTTKLKYASGQEIKETDPYFKLEMAKLDVPIDPEKELESTYVQDCKFCNGLVIASYYVNYKIPDDISLENLSASDFDKYYTNATGLFSIDGKLIKDISAGGNEVLDAAMDKDGNIALLCSFMDTNSFNTMVQIQLLDPEGNLLKTLYPNDLPFSAEYGLDGTIQILSDGRFAISGGNSLAVYDNTGKKCYTISEPGRSIGKAIFSQNGKYYVTSGIYDFTSGSEIQIKEVDIQTGTLGRSIDADYLDYFNDFQETEQGLFVNSPYGCYKIDIEKGELTQVFEWNETDINRQHLWSTTIIPKNEDELYATGIDFGNEGTAETILMHLTRQEKNPHAGKKIIVAAGLYPEMNEDLMGFIYDYNRDPDNKCRVVILDYTEQMVLSGETDDISKRIYLDILSGDGPDILLNMATASAFQTEDVMVDMNQYFDGEDGISRDQYFDNIFRAQEKNGKLYHVPIRVSFTGIEVNTNLISNTIGWTFDEFEAAGESVPADVSFIEGKEYNDFLSMLLESTISEFVDYKAKTVDFENDKMKRILQLAGKYGVREVPEDEGMDFEYVGNGTYMGGEDRTSVKFQSDCLAARIGDVSSLREYAIERDAMNGHIAFLGMPSSNGGGMQADVYLSVGIVASSKYKDLAWDVIRNYLAYSADYVPESGFSVNRETFDREMHHLMERINKEYDEIAESGGDMSMYKGMFAAATEEDIATIRELVENADSVTCSDDVIIDVITEEAAGYFAGDRTAEEVLKNIQNRTATVLKEL